MEMTSRIPDFGEYSVEEKIRVVKEFSNLADDEVKLLEKWMYKYPPLDFAVNFRIKLSGKSSRDYIIPMVIEERYVVPAANNGARLTRYGEGIITSYSGSYMIGQIQLDITKTPIDSINSVSREKERILAEINKDHYHTKAKDIETRFVETPKGIMAVVHLIVDTGDSMGAMTVTRMCERASEYLEKITGMKSYAKILSNYPYERIVKTEVALPRNVLSEGEIDCILHEQLLAESDPYRCVTRNKGVMNGVIAVGNATLNDTRAIEAAAHAYEWMYGRCKPFSEWFYSEMRLVGRLEMPIVVGTVGRGYSSLMHPKANLARKILGIENASELAQIMGAVGLAQNLAAIWKVSTEGISRGHEEIDKNLM